MLSCLNWLLIKCTSISLPRAAAHHIFLMTLLKTDQTLYNFLSKNLRENTFNCLLRGIGEIILGFHSSHASESLTVSAHPIAWECLQTIGAPYSGVEGGEVRVQANKN